MSSGLRLRGLAGKVIFQPSTPPINESCGACNKDHVWVRRDYPDDPNQDRYEITTNALAGATATDPVIFPSSSLTGEATRFQLDPRVYVAPAAGDPEPNWPAVRGGAVTAANPTAWDTPGPYSAAIGLNGEATGKLSTAMGGDGNVASGEGSTAVGGQTNTASGASSVAMGVNAAAAGDGSFHWVSAGTGAPATVADNQFVLDSAGGFAAIVTDSGVPPPLGEILLDGATVATGKVTVPGIVDPDWVVTPASAANPVAANPSFSSLGTYWVYDDIPSVPLFSANTAATVQLGDGTVGTAAVGPFEFNTTITPTVVGASVVTLTVAAAAGNVFSAGGAADLTGTDARLHLDCSGTTGTLVAGWPATVTITGIDVNQSVYFGTDNTVGDGRCFVGGDTNSTGANATANRKFIGGGQSNQASANVADCSIGGGQSNVLGTLEAAIGGGSGHNVQGDNAVVVGGQSNAVTVGNDHGVVIGGNTNSVGAADAGIGGGANNTSTGARAVVVGGNTNSATQEGAGVGGGGAPTEGNAATGTRACVVGGLNGQAAGDYAVILGGRDNVADGASSLTLGQAADTNGRDNAFVWSGRTTGLDASHVAATDQFSAIFTGGYRFWSDADRTVGAQISPGGSGWSVLCDRDQKENLRPFENVLDRVERLPVYEYNYAAHEPERVTRGPVAQDWHELFGSEDPLRIGTLDADAVALAALRELIARADELGRAVQEGDSTIAALERALEPQAAR